MRHALDLRAPGIAEAEQLRGLVEGLADGVVHRVAKQDIVADATHGDDLGMAAGGEKQAIGKIDAVGQPRGERMRLQMIDRDQRCAVDQSDRLGGGQAHDDAADQARSGGRGDAVERGEIALRFRHRLRDQQVQHLDMGTGCNFRHHATERGMFVGLRQHDVRQNPPSPVLIAFDDRGGGLVAGRFDAQHDHRLAIPAETRPYVDVRQGPLAAARVSIARFDGAIGFFRAPVADRYTRLSAGDGASPYRA